MCLLLIAIDAVAAMPLVVLGNRDELHARASAAAAPWLENARIAGGRDLVADGSWMALASAGRFAAVTNVRRAVAAKAPRSRGWLVRDFLLGESSPAAFVESVAAGIDEYGPCNLVVADRDEVIAYDGAERRVRVLGRGVYVISNGAIDADWPKTRRLRRAFAEALTRDRAIGDESALLDALGDETPAADAALPDTGVGIDIERRLAPIFIRGETYGTRASTLIVRGADRHVRIVERRFGPGGRAEGQTQWQAAPMQAFRS